VRIVGAPAQQAESIKTAIGGFIDEFAGFHHDHVGIDVQVLFKLSLEFDRHKTWLRQVTAEDITVVDGGLEAVRIASIGQQSLGRNGVEVVPSIAGAAIGDAARREVGGHFRAVGEEVIHDALAVNTHSDGLAHSDVVEGLKGIGHGQVEDVGAGDRQEGQGRVVLHSLEIIRAEVGDVVNIA